MAGQSSTGDIVLDGCRVPAAQLIGEPGRGLALALGRITVNRLLHCPAMLGLAQVALRDARDYALGRQQFGRSIAQFQSIQHMLADMATEWMAARALMVQTARAIDAGIDARAQASMSKLFCSETAFRIADRAVDRKSTRLNSSHLVISYAVFCLKKKIYISGPSQPRTSVATQTLSPDSAPSLLLPSDSPLLSLSQPLTLLGRRLSGRDCYSIDTR